jgi:DNA modification methylase
MIPQVARRLIERYSKPKNMVLDPFCGSGSVLVESRLLNRSSIGVDVNPLACILAKAKTTPIEPRLLKDYWVKFKEEIGREILKLKFGELKVKPLELPNLYYWFKPRVAEELTILRKYLDDIKDDGFYYFFATCFSITVREVSNLRSGEFKIYRLPPERLKSHNPNVFEVFSQHAEENINRMVDFYERTYEKNVTCEVLFGDTRRLPLESESIDLVVTSPPYGDSKTTVAYGQFSKFSSLWLGLKEEIVMKVDKISLGGSPIKIGNLPSESLKETVEAICKRSGERSKEALWYFADLYECLKQLCRVLKQGKSHCCFVVGNRTIRRVQVPTDRIIAELGKTLGFKHEKTIYRRIPSKRMPWMNAPENIPGEKGPTISHESIVVLSL